MSSSVLAAAAGRFDRLRRLWQNPVTVKELRSRMRGRRAFVVLTIYLTIMSGLVLLVYLAYEASAATPFGAENRLAGKVILGSVVGVQCLLVMFMGPSFTTAAITSEKERQTYELLRTTTLSPQALVSGKLVSAMSYVLLLQVASIPLQSIAFFLGGVTPIEIIASQLVIAAAGLAFAMIGLYFSSAMRTTQIANVATFIVAMGLTFLTPFLALILGTPISALFLVNPIRSWVTEMLLAYGGLALAATNLPATLIVSEAFLLEEGAIFFWKESFRGHTVYLPSPWWLAILFYLLVTFIFFKAAVGRVGRTSEK